MGRIVYVEGGFRPEEEARVSVFDRGLLFGDSIYEVTAVIDGRMVDNALHLARLERSLGELAIPMPMSRAEIAAVQQELITRNALVEGVVYLQISRGIEDRDFLYSGDLQPQIFGFTQAKKLSGTKAQAEGIAVDLVDDPRWQRRDIKTTMLLGQVIAKRHAKARGFQDVWMVENDLITEGASSTAHIITHDGVIVTRAPSQVTLPGCTTRAMAALAEAEGLRIEHRAFSPAEAQGAAEAFLTSASSFVIPVVRIGDVAVADGRPGPLTRRLQEAYLAAARAGEAAQHD